jgi:hypothetical protein
MTNESERRNWFSSSSGPASSCAGKSRTFPRAESLKLLRRRETGETAERRALRRDGLTRESSRVGERLRHGQRGTVLPTLTGSTPFPPAAPLPSTASPPAETGRRAQHGRRCGSPPHISKRFSRRRRGDSATPAATTASSVNSFSLSLGRGLG